MAILQSSKTSSTFDTDTGKVLPTNSTGFAQVAPVNINTPSAANVTQLQTPPLTVPSSPIGNSIASGLQQQIQTSTVDTAKQAQQQAIDEQKQLVSSGQSDIINLTNQLGNSGALKENLYNKLGVNDAQQKVDEYTSQIEAEALAARRQIEDLQKNNPQGLFGGALNDEVNRIQRESTSKQADLAILQNASLRKYSTMSAIADRKLEMFMEPIRTRLDTLKFIYNENKESLNKKEERQYSEKIKTEERQYKEQYEQQKALSDTRLKVLQIATEQGAPTAVTKAIMDAKTPEEAFLAAGQYSGDILARRIKQQQLTNLINAGKTATLTTKEAADISSDPAFTNVSPESVPLVNLLNKYKNSLQNSTAVGLLTSPSKNAELKGLESLITAEYKQAKKLGTLDAGVQKLIDGLLGNVGLAKFSNKARITAIDGFLSSEGYDPSKEVNKAALSQQLAPGEILVRDLQGNVGAIPEKEYNPAVYIKL